ncbi:class I SAM-dependent methyltransferase [Pseudomonas sp. LRF_L74]|uniref:class I SAM-dependent methyltransferase n=1 Tax=Pseudomonas sp. LRF_L74 TaxID=3369422 RepID=UPI003F62126C
MDEHEQIILDVWRDNAAPWTHAVRTHAIASRRLVTDRVILDTVLAQHPRHAIDLGCGEGWLTRALSAEGIDTLGIDAILSLVESARTAGGGRFIAMDYAEVSNGALHERADVVVCNFALLGGTSVDTLLRAVPALLEPGGALVVQTLHPFSACGDAPYVDGWREGSWQGCGEGFGKAAPWYFRTMQGWIGTLKQAGLRLADMLEPPLPGTGRPASLVLIARVC